MTNSLDTIALQAIKNYNGDFSSVTFFAKETSTIYKVVDTSSKEYALKIYDDASSNLADNKVEQFLQNW